MKLEQIVTFSGKIRCMSGLCIGGSSSTIDIGGIDREVIKNPITKEPYIPGSSLKGKMRSELEKRYGTMKWENDTNEIRKQYRVLSEKKGKVLIDGGKEPCGCGQKTCNICTVFGAHKFPGAPSGPTRIIVRDAVLCKDGTDSSPLILERKTENCVSRISDTADAPRTMERVPEGTYFDFEIILRIFEGDNAENLIQEVTEGLNMVEQSYLGGCGSRGSGHVKFEYEVTCSQKASK